MFELEDFVSCLFGVFFLFQLRASCILTISLNPYTRNEERKYEDLKCHFTSQKFGMRKMKLMA